MTQQTNKHTNSPQTAVLLDTTEQSSLGWTKYPDGGPATRTPGWVEESFTNFERGINWRSFVVCDVAFNSVNNWLWTPYIERGDANRLYIEIKFTMRDCNLFPQMVLSCKETFALLYKEVDGPMQASSGSSSSSSANASFASSDDYVMIDAIAADEGRFTSANDVVINTEIRSIPVSKRGVYFAFRDQGACLSLISIKVYHLSCPQLTSTSSLARFNATPTGRDPTSLVAVEGECVANSIQIEPPKMFCSADGRWNSMSSGQCKCLAGYEPAANATRCQPCPPGKFKWQSGDGACQPCPERSSSFLPGATECKCHEGFFRPTHGKDSRVFACTQPPGPPQNLTAVYVDSSSVILQWQPPARHTSSDLITYRLICDQCDAQASLVTSPQFYANFSETKCVLSGLAPSTQYRFVVYAMNSLTNQHQQAASPSSSAPQFSEIIVQTSQPAQQTASNTLSSQNGFQLLPIFNFRALPGARGTDMVLAWDSAPSANLDLLVGSELTNGDSSALPSLYEVRFQPRFGPSGSHLDSTAMMMARRSPYSPLFTPPSGSAPTAAIEQQSNYQSVTTTNRAVAISNVLLPRTEYSFQIRAKWLHSNQWTDWSAPTFMATSNQVPSNAYPFQQDPPGLLSPFDPTNPPPYLQPQQQLPGSISSSGASWLKTFLLVVFCCLFLAVFATVTLIHYRKSTASCLQSLSISAGFGHLGSTSGHSTYAGVYNGGTSSDLIGGAGNGIIGGLHSSIINTGSNGSGQTNGGSGTSSGSPSNLSQHHLYHNAGNLHHFNHLTGANQHHLHATLAGGGLIAGSNSTSRSSSSGAGNVVQNFIAATLGQISGNHHSHNHNQQQQQQQNKQDAKLFSGNNNLEGTPSGQLRNHYHQMLGNVNHSLLVGANQNHGQNNAGHHFQPPTLPIVPPASGQQLVGVASGGIYGPAAGDLFASLQQQQHLHHGNQMTKPYATRALTTNRQGKSGLLGLLQPLCGHLAALQVSCGRNFNDPG